MRAVATAAAAMPAASVPGRGWGGRPGTPSPRGRLAGTALNYSRTKLVTCRDASRSPVSQ